MFELDTNFLNDATVLTLAPWAMQQLIRLFILVLPQGALANAATVVVTLMTKSIQQCKPCKHNTLIHKLYMLNLKTKFPLT
jgi:hypothetical protein